MKRFSILLVLIVVACSCSKKEDDSSGSNSGGTQGGGIQIIACAEAIYPRWQDSPYVLPYPVGTSYRVNLNHCSSSYHREGQPDQFAIDFNMAIGTEISCSRDGVVVHVEEDGIDGHFPNNLVVVRHVDDSFAQYMHLTQNGAAVEVGDLVAKGDLIGFSGSTGLAGSPHLHFVVTGPGSWGYPYHSIPYNFSNTAPNPRGPNMGENYEALPY